MANVSFKEFVDGMRNDRNIFHHSLDPKYVAFKFISDKMKELLASYASDADDDALAEVLGLKGTDAEGGICVDHVDAVYRNLLLALFGP